MKPDSQSSFWNKLKPTALSADDRAAIIHEIEDGALLSKRYVTLTIIATIIAAFGLITNSVATIVGAMIIEPSMGPIMGLALGLVRLNWKLKQHSLLATVVGILLAILVGYLSGKAPVDMGITQELNVRTMPTLLDMVVAYASGLAAGYAYVNPKVNPALAGVAVSVSLVPPLAASGFFLAHGMPSESTGAFLMFFANFICIQLAAVLVFAFYRMGRVKRASLRTMYVVQFLPYVVMVGMVGAYLTYTLRDLVALSQQKSVIRKVIRGQFGLSDADITLDLKHINGENDARIVLPIQRGLSKEDVQNLKNTIEAEIKAPITLRLRAYPVDEHVAE
jgi:uncharacterized hydrophobic protein (TIGR00271 family)